MSLVDRENVNSPLGSFEQILKIHHNDSAIIQSPQHERDFQLIASLLFDHVL